MSVIQIILMSSFMAIVTAGLPKFWLHPFGPLTKNIPIVVATLTMMAIEE